MTRKKLNDAVLAHFKDGTTVRYPSLKNAAKQLNLTELSIKIRANKPGATGSDGITFDWADDHTKKSMCAKKNRNKGSSLEYDIVKKLRELGYDAKTARGESKTIDNSKVDIICPELPTYIQAKHTKNLPNYFDIKSACLLKDKPFTIVWKKSASGGRSSPGTVAVMDINLFYSLLEMYYNINKNK